MREENGRRQAMVFDGIGPIEGGSTYGGTHVGYIRIEATGDRELETD